LNFAADFLCLFIFGMKRWGGYSALGMESNRSISHPDT
jgi:hypothetical protein